uniref:dUTPase-like domain-containing protein n=1 Tax=Laticauda laticaudata TaxID=8630 RepID=A0A8C5RY06_LATLA
TILRLSRSNKSTIENTSAATRGSAGIDLILQDEVNFKFPGEVQIVPSQLSAPLPQNYVGLVLPQSNIGKKGIFVIPGVIDSDYTGITYPKERGEGGFGSTDLATSIIAAITSCRLHFNGPVRSLCCRISPLGEF